MEQDLQQTLLEQLRDIHLPAEVSWWPPAIGWWILLALFLLAGIFAIWAWFQNRQKNHYRKLAINALEEVFTQWQQAQDNARFVQKANELLKRTLSEALIETLNDPFMSLSGNDWIALLNRCAKAPFTEDSANALARSGYEANPEVDVPQLYAEVKRWILHHRQPTGSLSPSLSPQEESARA